MALLYLASAGATLLAFGLWKLIRMFWIEHTSQIRFVPGPSSTHWLFGNYKEFVAAESSALHEGWASEYGNVFKYHGFLQAGQLNVMDPRAISHILTHTYLYQKPAMIRTFIGRVIGNGIVVAEEDPHKTQRRVMNPAFGPAQIRELTEIFVEKSIQLRDLWSSELDKVGHSGRLEVFSWLSKVTLDIIGLAGFHYQFDALDPEKPDSELEKAFTTVLRPGERQGILPILQAWYPIFRIIPGKRETQIKIGRKTMNRIGRQLLSESKASNATAERLGEKSVRPGRDLLSLLVRANTAKDLPENQRLSDEDVVAQVPTFLVAGHETTSTATTWALFALTQAPETQSKLRKELLTCSTETPTMDELNALPYLDAVVREALRMHSPVPNIVRQAMKEDVIPLSTPYVDVNGTTQTEIRMYKGQYVFIPIQALNKSKAIWGPDATVFRPERWESIPEAAHHAPGVWGNQMTFVGGPRSCIGYRFSVVEMKALLFVLVRAFEFLLAVPASNILSKQTAFQRPCVRTDPEGGNQLPLIVKP